MQKITVVAVTETRHKKDGFVNIQLKREVLASELNGGKSGKRVSFLGKSKFEKTGRVAFLVMEKTEQERLGLVPGADLNAQIAEEYGEHAIQVLEVTDAGSVDADIALSLTDKENPSTGAKCLHGGVQILQTTILVAVEDFNEDGGDITLSIDKEA